MYLFEAKQETIWSTGALIGVLVRGWLRVDAKGTPSSFGLTGGGYSEEGMGTTVTIEIPERHQGG